MSGLPLPPSLSLDASGLPRAGGQLLPLPPKERSVLRLLIQHRFGVVSKDEFAAAAWDGQAMSDESLARCISTVRRVLKPWDLKVEAVYGLGYRLVAPPPPESVVRGPSPQGRDTLVHARQLLQQRTPAAVGRATDLLRGLIRDEPGYAAARVALADALVVATGWGQVPTPPAVQEGLAALDGAGDGSEPGVHAARAGLLDMAWRFDEAAHCFELALAADGDNPDTLLAWARHLLYTDQAAQAVDVLRQVLRLVPHALHPRMVLTRALVQGGRGADAVAEVQSVLADHPGQLVLQNFALAIRAMVDPQPELEAAVRQFMQMPEPPPFVWTVASYVLARLGRRDAALEIIDMLLLCSATTAGEASLYAAPLAALGDLDRAAGLLRIAVDERCGMMAMVLRDPAHGHWLPQHPAGRALLRTVFGEGAARPGPR